MKTSEFNKILQQAQRVDIANSPVFNTAGYFWLNLTEKQVGRMYLELIAQGNEKKHDPERGDYVELKNGSRIYNPASMKK